jgi:hypothetical protein
MNKPYNPEERPAVIKREMHANGLVEIDPHL